MGEILQTSSIGEGQDDGDELPVSVLQGEGQVGLRDQMGSVSLMRREVSGGPVPSELCMGHPDRSSCA